MEGPSALKPMALWACRLLLAGTFGYAAIGKIADPQGFVTDVSHYRILPYWLTLVVGVYLPWLELVCAIGVLSRWRERAALWLTLTLCAMFCLALSAAWARGLDITCGCFGHSTESSALPTALIRALVLGLGAVVLLKSPSVTAPVRSDN